MTALPAPAADPAHVASLTRRVRDTAGRSGLADVAVERHDSPFGPLFVCGTAGGIVRVGLPGDDEDEALAQLAARISPRVLRTPAPAVTQARRELDEYFAGTRTAFAVPLDWRLTHGFRGDVLHVLADVPYGSTVTYAELAARAGRPAAVRAAGSAMATNPLPLLVPCHRVLRTGGAVGSYRGGTAMKEGLLALERGQ